MSSFIPPSDGSEFYKVTKSVEAQADADQKIFQTLMGSLGDFQFFSGASALLPQEAPTAPEFIEGALALINAQNDYQANGPFF